MPIRSHVKNDIGDLYMKENNWVINTIWRCQCQFFIELLNRYCFNNLKVVMWKLPPASVSCTLQVPSFHNDSYAAVLSSAGPAPLLHLLLQRSCLSWLRNHSLSYWAYEEVWKCYFMICTYGEVNTSYIDRILIDIGFWAYLNHFRCISHACLIRLIF